MWNLIDLTGKRFGKLVVVSRNRKAEKSRRPKWDCVCDCGRTTTMHGDSLRRGSSKSCGCNKGALITQKKIRHGHSIVGHVTRTYRIWNAIKSRCTLPALKSYKDYGGRGITVDPLWVSDFQNFLNDMGEAPNRMEINRIDNDLGYCKENCQWSTKIEQANNKRNNKFVEYNGFKLTIAQWVRFFGLKYLPTWKQLKSGLTFDEILGYAKPIEVAREAVATIPAAGF